MKFGLILATDFQEENLNSLAPIGLGCLEAIINQKLPDVEIIFKENPADLIKDSPDIIGISSTTEYYHLAILWASEIKKQLGIPVIIGGIHISLLPQSMTDDFDVAIIGEGDFTIIDFLQSFIKNSGLNYNELASIPGLYFKQHNQPTLTPQRPLIKNLDLLPRIKWQNLPYYRWHQAHIVASRGCPYKCSFCASEKFSRQYRYYSADSIVKEIEYFVLEKKLGGITFFDDLLIANKKRLTELVEKLGKKNLLGKCRFHCQVRANLVDDDICELLKKLNIATLGIGIETFSDKILRYYNKTGITAEINQQAIDRLSKYGFKVNPSIIFGAPIETKEDMLLTLRAIYKNFKEGKLTSPAWTLLRPYPGTAIWEYAEKKGFVSTNMDWSIFANWGTYDHYLCENVSANEFKELICEWQTKITLLNYDKLDTLGGNFLIRDQKELYNNTCKLQQTISKRIQVTSKKDYGDDLILSPPMYENRPIIYLNGWYPKEENTHWMHNTAEAVIVTEKSEQIIFKGYIPPQIFQKTYNGSIEILFYNDQDLLFSGTCRSDTFPDGNIQLTFAIPSNDKINLKITTNKSFVPKKIDSSSQDERELSIVVCEIIT